MTQKFNIQINDSGDIILETNNFIVVYDKHGGVIGVGNDYIEGVVTLDNLEEFVTILSKLKSYIENGKDNIK